MNIIEKILDSQSIIPLLLEYEENNITEKEYQLDHCTIIFHSLGDIEVIPHVESQCDLIYSSGIHGNETAPIEICSKILYQILKQEIIPANRTLFLFGNFEGMKTHQRFIDFNLNRLFNDNFKNYPKTYEAKRAQQLQDSVIRFTKTNYKKLVHLDLHTAIRDSYIEKFAISPVANDRDNPEMDYILSSMNLGAILFTNQDSTTFSDFGARFKNSIAFTVELGKVRPFGENDMTNFDDAIKTLVKMICGEKLEKDNELKKFDVYKEIIRESEDLEFFIGDDLTNFTKVEPGNVIYKQNGHDSSFDQELRVVFAHPTVKLGQRAGFLVKEI